jgi:carboxymethylenebutenolidase
LELLVYEAKNAFANARRPEVYDAAAAELAWSRALAFVRAHAA